VANFIKRGKSARSEIKKINKQQQANKEKAENLFFRRYWMPAESENQIIFLTGKLDEEGFLDIPCWYEHQPKLNGSFKGNHFICVGEEEPCPFCEITDVRQNFVGGLLILDCSKWTDKQGKVHKNELKFFVPKKDTIDKLTRIAGKRKTKSLVGCKFDVVRSNSNAVSVGDEYDFIKQYPLKKLVEHYKIDKKHFALNKLISSNYKSAKEINKLGIGVAPLGSEDGEEFADFDEAM